MYILCCVKRVVVTLVSEILPYRNGCSYYNEEQAHQETAKTIKLVVCTCN